MVFPGSVLVLYLVLFRVAPENTLAALRSSIGILSHVLLPLCLVFLLMAGLNIFLKPPQVAEFLGKGGTIRKKLLSAVAGIISAGPIYAWYPILKDLREKGADNALIAIFLINRSVKPFLLPVMISFFGWAYVLILTLLTVVGSFFAGSLIGAFSDHPSNLKQNEDP